jgi:putative tryptophan/tyrosine transport system substrate-binding protein
MQFDQRRREFIGLLGSAAVAWPRAARAQQSVTASAWARRLEPLRAGLRDLGYVEGRTVIIEFRWADRIEQLREHAAA